MQPNKEPFWSSYERGAEREHSKLPKKIERWKETCADEVVNAAQLLVQSDGETYCCC